MTKAPDDRRPDPNMLLAQVTAEEARSARGKLKIFFGAAAGVGKTYAMLGAGRAKAAEGVDVVVGYAEPHARTETEAMLLGLELLPFRMVDYRGARLREFDLDAALKRRPEVLLVDELAHTNAPGSRHDKRWQDIEELLRAGIDVYSTLNVQHIESFNDVVAQITGVTVRETLPDTVFEQADEVELVDLSPEDLLERLREGKVYVGQHAQQAMLGFFRKANLSALRELSLRKTAERVNEEVQLERLGQSPRKTWPTAERVLVCISPNKSSAKVIRSAKRLAVSLHAEWVAAFVETPRLKGLDVREREQLQKNTRLAERLGAETVTLSGLNVVEELVNYARGRNVTKIVAGKPDRPWWIDLWFRSHVDQLLRKSGEIDVYAVRGIGGDGHDETPEPTPHPSAGPGRMSAAPYAWSVLTVLACSLVAALLDWRHFDLSNLIMIYLVGVVAVSARHGRGPSCLAAVLSVLAFDFFFVSPRLTLAVGDTQYILTFGVMLGVALLIGTLTVRIRDQAEASRERERRTEALYRMTQQLAGTRGLVGLCEAASRQLADVFHSRVVILTRERGDKTKQLVVRASYGAPSQLPESERGVAQWVFEHQQPAGAGTDTLPSAAAQYLPLVVSRGAIGAVGLSSESVADLLSPALRPLLDAFLNQIALAIERDELADEARHAQVQAEAESLRSSLLSSVSHDLRTPLAIITSASSSLIESSVASDDRETAQAIHNEATRLSRLVANLLDITRLESGAVNLAKQWQPIEEVIGSALRHVEPQLAGRKVTTAVSAGLPMVPMDGVLIEQVLINLLENAARHTPDGTPIQVEARRDATGLLVGVLDRGPGVAAGEEHRIFEKFVRGAGVVSRRGVGLGLAICRAAVDAHGGRIWVENRADAEGGVAFKFTLPIVGSPPPVVEEEIASTK